MLDILNKYKLLLLMFIGMIWGTGTILDIPQFHDINSNIHSAWTMISEHMENNPTIASIINNSLIATIVGLITRYILLGRRIKSVLTKADLSTKDMLDLVNDIKENEVQKLLDLYKKAQILNNEQSMANIIDQLKRLGYELNLKSQGYNDPNAR